MKECLALHALVRRERIHRRAREGRKDLFFLSAASAASVVRDRMICGECNKEGLDSLQSMLESIELKAKIVQFCVLCVLCGEASYVRTDAPSTSVVSRTSAVGG